MKANTVHLLLNPTANRGRATLRQTRIIKLLKNSGIEVILYVSESRGDLEESVLRYIEHGATKVIVAGGDGSIHEAVNGIMQSGGNVALGIIPIGTGNDFAKSADIPLDWEYATRQLASRIAGGKIQKTIDIGRLNNRFFANGAGIGFDAKTTYVAESILLPIGRFVYLAAILKTMIGGIVSPNLEIQSDGFSWKGPVTLASISNGPWVGGIFHIAPMANNTDGRLELLITKPLTRRRILSLLPKLMNGKHIEEPEVTHKSITHLLISAETPIPAQLDGEIQAPQTNFEIEIVPNVLKLL